MIDFTPALRDQALTIISKYKIGPVFTPPVESKLEGPLATLTLGTASGGTNWPGGSYDPETHIVYAFACNACLTPIGLVKSPKEVSDMNYIAGTAGQEPRMRLVLVKTPARIRRCLHARSGSRRRWQWLRSSDRARFAADQTALRNHLGHQSGQG